jgi:hypothetical protein
MLTDTETRHLPCPLTDRELIEKGDLQARGLQDLRDLEDEKAKVAKDYGEQIKDKRSELNKLSREISTRTEVRPIRCDVMFVPEEDKAITIRTDTGERIEVRSMTSEERDRLAQRKQPGLFDDAH